MNRQLICVSFALVFALLVQSISAEQSTKEIEEQQLGPRGNEGKYLQLSPSLLTRFLNYQFPRQIERQANLAASVGPIGGFKRSSSALDALTGVTLGKRSAPSLGLVNYEPILATMRSGPRMYDIRWSPYEALDNGLQLEYN